MIDMILSFWAYFRKPYKIVNVHTASYTTNQPYLYGKTKLHKLHSTVFIPLFVIATRSININHELKLVCYVPNLRLVLKYLYNVQFTVNLVFDRKPDCTDFTMNIFTMRFFD